MATIYAGEVTVWSDCCHDGPSGTPNELHPWVVSLNSLYGILTLAGAGGIEISSLSSTITIGLSSSVPVLPYVGANFRIKADGTLQNKNTTTGLFHTVGAAGTDGSGYMTMNDTGEA